MTGQEKAVDGNGTEMERQCTVKGKGRDPPPVSSRLDRRSLRLSIEHPITLRGTKETINTVLPTSHHTARQCRDDDRLLHREVSGYSLRRNYRLPPIAMAPNHLAMTFCWTDSSIEVSSQSSLSGSKKNFSATR